MVDPEEEKSKRKRRDANGSRPTAGEKRILLYGAQLYGRKRKAEAALGFHRAAGEGQ